VEQRVSLVTLGVRDLGTAPGQRDCGRALGREELVEDTGVEDTAGWGGITLAYNTRSPATSLG
jgi:hypothetical protein